MDVTKAFERRMNRVFAVQRANWRVGRTVALVLLAVFLVNAVVMALLGHLDYVVGSVIAFVCVAAAGGASMLLLEVTKDPGPGEVDARLALVPVPWKRPRPETVDEKARACQDFCVSDAVGVG